MIRGVSGFRGMFRPVRPNLRMQLLRESLHRNSMVQFRYRGSRQTGRVLELQPRTVVIEFRYRGTDRTEIVKYSSILRVLGP